MKKLMAFSLKALLGVLSVLMVSCELFDKSDEPFTPGINYYEVPSNAVVTMDHFDFFINDNLQGTPKISYLSGIGQSSAPNLINFSWSQSHTAIADAPDHLQIIEGTFELKNDAGEELSGTYYGTGSSDESKRLLNATLMLTITGGTGRYANSEGNISAILNPTPGVQPEFVLKLQGELFRIKTTD